MHAAPKLWIRRSVTDKRRSDLCRSCPPPISRPIAEPVGTVCPGLNPVGPGTDDCNPLLQPARIKPVALTINA